MGGEGRSDAEEKVWQEAHGIAMLPTYDVVALDDMADLIVALVDRVVAEQTAALREENARLRGAAMALVEWCEHDYGDMRMCRVCAGMAIRRDEAVPHAECPVARLGALLADREGQRAGEVEILRERLEFFAGLLTEKDGELAALREATAPLVCIDASHPNGDSHTLGCQCPCRVCQARVRALADPEGQPHE